MGGMLWCAHRASLLCLDEWVITPSSDFILREHFYRGCVNWWPRLSSRGDYITLYFNFRDLLNSLQLLRLSVKYVFFILREHFYGGCVNWWPRHSSRGDYITLYFNFRDLWFSLQLLRLSV